MLSAFSEDHGPSWQQWDLVTALCPAASTPVSCVTLYLGKKEKNIYKNTVFYRRSAYKHSGSDTCSKLISFLLLFSGFFLGVCSLGLTLLCLSSSWPVKFLKHGNGKIPALWVCRNQHFLQIKLLEMPHFGSTWEQVSALRKTSLCG